MDECVTPKAFASWQTLLQLSIAVLVVSGNATVIVIFISHRRLRTVTNVLISSLAMSDLLVGLIVMPVNIYSEMIEQVWPFGPIWCEVWLAFSVWIGTASIFNLVVISFDRYMAITRPLKYRKLSTMRLARRLMAGVWVLAFVVGLPPLARQLLLPHGHSSAGSCQCSLLDTGTFYIVYSSLGSIFIPLLLILTFNCSIYRKVRRAGKAPIVHCSSVTPSSLRVHRRKPPAVLRRVSSVPAMDVKGCRRNCIVSATATTAVNVGFLTPIVRARVIARLAPKRLSLRTEPSAAAVSFMVQQTSAIASSVGSLIANQTADLFTIRAEAELRVAKTVGLVVGSFVVCWLPFAVVYIVSAFDGLCSDDGCRTERVEKALLWLGYSNSAVNPMIYALLSRDFQSAATLRRRATVRRQMIRASHSEGRKVTTY